MQADNDELVHGRFTGEMVSMLLHIDNDMYKDYVVTEKGEMVMYMELLKALYGTLRTARLFWQKLSKQLIDVWGFTPNKYDDCVVNKTINGHQMTVVWHVDDLKVSHVDGKEVDKFIMQMEETFGTELSVSHGKIHDYLGMNLDFCFKGEVWIDMEHYIYMMLQDVPEDMEGVSNTPAAVHLFKTNDAGLISKPMRPPRHSHHNCILMWPTTQPQPGRLQKANPDDTISPWNEEPDPHFAGK